MLSNIEGTGCVGVGWGAGGGMGADAGVAECEPFAAVFRLTLTSGGDPDQAHVFTAR